MARRIKRHRKSGSAHKAKFARIARTCMSKLRAGHLPKKGDFGKCLRRAWRK
ncbi:MAG: hypothetical protein Q8R92_07795 [Deltaproteobacteria bacterium]|nr:hypothetical protein [Deltaproteobacteria bacterium]